LRAERMKNFAQLGYATMMQKSRTERDEFEAKTALNTKRNLRESQARAGKLPERLVPSRTNAFTSVRSCRYVRFADAVEIID